ncbi:MAG: hypothetical protein WBM52_19670, partial [Thiogranum sp.]
VSRYDKFTFELLSNERLKHSYKNQATPVNKCSSDTIHNTIESSSILTDAKIDATYNRTPSEPKPRFPVDKHNATLYN